MHSEFSFGIAPLLAMVEQRFPRFGPPVVKVVLVPMVIVIVVALAAALVFAAKFVWHEAITPFVVFEPPDAGIWDWTWAILQVFGVAVAAILGSMVAMLIGTRLLFQFGWNLLLERIVRRRVHGLAEKIVNEHVDHLVGEHMARFHQAERSPPA